MIIEQQYYIPTARELARLAGIQRAPILHHFAESLAGTATIRAFEQQDRFTDVNLVLIDHHSRPWFHNVSAMEWLSFRLNLLSNFVFAFSLILLVTLPEGVINPSKYHMCSKFIFSGLVRNISRRKVTIEWSFTYQSLSYCFACLVAYHSHFLLKYNNITQWKFLYSYRHCWVSCNIWNKSERSASFGYMEHM